MENKYNICKISDNDDIKDVARLIYLSDKYIYPRWFDSIDDGIKVISEMINLPTIYNRKNIIVAKTQEDKIVGMMIALQTPFSVDFNMICKAFELAKVKCDKRTNVVFDDYYSKMGLAEDGFYIANLTVDESFQRQGIASELLKSIIKNNNHCSLECVVDNCGAWRLYERLGFKIKYEYIGACDVLCYKMVYNK